MLAHPWLLQHYDNSQDTKSIQMDETEQHHVKQNKPDAERQIIIFIPIHGLVYTYITYTYMIYVIICINT